jgi:Ni2+-binding GTPase involved in maturation of urease and hydrogenase
MIDRTVQVQISGVTASGKTNIAMIVAQALRQAGVPFGYQGPDFQTAEDFVSFMDERSDKIPAALESMKRNDFNVEIVETVKNDHQI